MGFAANAEQLKRDPDIMQLVPQGSINKAIARGKNFGIDNQVRQNGGDDRQVTINADTVILEKAINGNGKKKK